VFDGDCFAMGIKAKGARTEALANSSPEKTRILVATDLADEELTINFYLGDHTKLPTVSKKIKCTSNRSTGRAGGKLVKHSLDHRGRSSHFKINNPKKWGKHVQPEEHG